MLTFISGLFELNIGFGFGFGLLEIINFNRYIISFTDIILICIICNM